MINAWLSALNMQKLTLFVLAFLFVLPAAGASVFAQQDEAAKIREMFEERDREIKSILSGQETLTEKERTRLKKVINQNIDFSAMGRAALGPLWSDLSQQQQQTFLDTFSEIVRTRSLANLEIYRAEVTYQDVTVEGDSARVSTTTTYDDVKTPVAYVLAKENGSWRVVDIVLDDISTVDSYARSFQTVIRKRGFDALMESLEKKLAEMKSST